MSCEFRDYSFKAQEFFEAIMKNECKQFLIHNSSLFKTSITIESEYPFPTAYRISFTLRL